MAATIHYLPNMAERTKRVEASKKKAASAQRSEKIGIIIAKADTYWEKPNV